MEFNDSVKNWLKSPQYKRFSKKLNENKLSLVSFMFDMDKVYESKQTTSSMITKNELNQLIEDILHYHNADEESKFDFELTSGEIVRIGTTPFNELLFEYIKANVNWNFYLKFYLEKEDFTFCARIRDVISAEQQEFIRLINLYAPIRFQLLDNYEQEIIQIDIESKKAFEFPC